MYTKNDKFYSRSAAIAEILNSLGSAIQPAYIDEETINLFGFLKLEQLEIKKDDLFSNQMREEALKMADWIINAMQLTDDTKKRVESWRWIVRNMSRIPDSTVIPPIPNVEEITNYFDCSSITEEQVNKIKNYYTSDKDWLTFLEVWKSFKFTNIKSVIQHLLVSYTNTNLDEIIGSI